MAVAALMAAYLALASALIPALRETWRGHQFVLQNSGPNGRLSQKEARRANQRFLRIADINRDGRVSDREARRALDGRGDRDAWRN
jgi:hypothetical protein